MPNLRDSPLDNVAEVLVVDVVVLFPNRPLSTFLELILAIAVRHESYWPLHFG
jgi:hypothetical protein